MKRLPSDFEISKYGVHCRLVNENDASFIVKLRSDEKRSRYIHSTDNDVESQKQWIRDYKIREANGVEYYFIYEADGVPFGVNRIYDMHDDHCTEGSGVCLPLEDSSKTIASAFEIFSDGLLAIVSGASDAETEFKKAEATMEEDNNEE